MSHYSLCHRVQCYTTEPTPKPTDSGPLDSTRYRSHTTEPTPKPTDSWPLDAMQYLSHTTEPTRCHYSDTSQVYPSVGMIYHCNTKLVWYRQPSLINAWWKSWRVDSKDVTSWLVRGILSLDMKCNLMITVEQMFYSTSFVVVWKLFCFCDLYYS